MIYISFGPQTILAMDMECILLSQTIVLKIIVLLQMTGYNFSNIFSIFINTPFKKNHLTHADG